MEVKNVEVSLTEVFEKGGGGVDLALRKLWRFVKLRIISSKYFMMRKTHKREILTIVEEIYGGKASVAYSPAAEQKPFQR